MQNVGN